MRSNDAGDSDREDEMRVQSYFYAGDHDDLTLKRLTGDAEVLCQTRKTIKVRGRWVEGWIVKLRIPATDGCVPFDYAVERGSMSPGEE